MKKQSLRKWMILVVVNCLLLTVFACESSLDDTPDNLPLFGAAPSIVQLTPRDKELVAQWTKVASAQGVAPDYEVYKSTSPDPNKAERFATVSSTLSNLVTCTITPLDNHITYYVWVRSVFGSLGASGFTMSYGVPVPPPVTPGDITVNPGDSMLELRWDEVPDAVSYNIFYHEGSFSADRPPEAATAAPSVLARAFIRDLSGNPRAMAPAVSAPGTVIGNLHDGITYTVWVQAENTAGKSSYSRNTGVPQAQAAPTVSPAIKTVTPGNKKLTLVWDQACGIPRYKIFYREASDPSAAREFTGNPIPANSPTVTAELTGLVNGTTYYVWVKSSNGNGDSPFGTRTSGAPQAREPIDWNNAQFKLGEATAEYSFAQDVPPSRFFPEGRPNTDRLSRVQETALGDLFTDATAWYVREVLQEPVDFVFLNGGFIDNVLPQGTITLGGLLGALQPDSRSDKIVFISLTGAQLKQFFGVSDRDPIPNSVAAVTHMGRGGHDTGDFGIVSQEIRYTIEYPKAPSGTRPELSSDEAEAYWYGRIKAGTLKFKGADIVDTQIYRICTTDYNASGVYYTIFATGGTNKVLTEIPFYRAIAEYIYDKQTVTPKLDGRIKLEGGVVLPPPWVNSTWNP